MNDTQTEISRRLLYILHRGLTQIRNLASAGGSEQIAELADTLEILPGMVDHWKDEDLEMVRFVLRNYEAKFPSSYNYLAAFEDNPVPERF